MANAPRKYTDEELEELPEHVKGQWYQFAVPGGFLMFGRFVRTLPSGMVRFADVRHLRNAGNVELPAMCAGEFSPTATKIIKSKWPYWDGIPIWKAPIDNPFAPILE